MPYEPTVYENESNALSDPAFEDINIESTYEVYQAEVDSDGNPHSLFGIVESIGTGTPDGGYVEPTEEHLSYRQAHTVSISNPMPVIRINSISTCARPIEGAGTRLDPYIIYTYEQLNLYLRSEQSSYFELGCDIDASPSRTENGGTGFAPIRYFAGFVNARGHTIQNLYINRPEQRMVGLFAHLIGAKISNLRLENVTVIGKYQVGALAGHMVRSLVDSIKVTGRVQGVGEVGGILGFQTSHFHSVDVALYYQDGSREFLIPYRTSEISNSHFKGLVNCARGAEAREFHRICGGITGWLASGYISRTTSSGSLIMSESSVESAGGSVTIDGDMAGGIVGSMGSNESFSPIAAGADVFQKARVYQSHSEISIYGGITIGGVVGAALRSANVIAESSSTSRIEGHSLLGGIVAMMEGSYMVNCYSKASFFLHHSTTPEASNTLPVGAITPLKFGYSDSVASGTDHFSVWQRIEARYLAASRFKIGIENSYSISETGSIRHLVSDPGLIGRSAAPIRNIAGYYYRLDGSLHSVVENISGIYSTNTPALDAEGNSAVSPRVEMHFTYLLSLNGTGDIWSIIDGSPQDELDGEDDTSFQYPLFGIINSVTESGSVVFSPVNPTSEAGPHGAERNSFVMTCVTVPGGDCPPLDDITAYGGWSTQVWDFGTDTELPVIRNSVSVPSDL